MTMCMDEETQKKGCTVVVYNVDHGWLDKFDKNLYSGLAAVKAATPIRVVAIHYCYSDPAFGAIIAFISGALERHVRIRTKLHQGELLFCCVVFLGPGMANSHRDYDAAFQDRMSNLSMSSCHLEFQPSHSL